MAKKLIEIDGNYLEGGGQIFRNALSLSCILQQPVHIRNIRGNRPNPGLSHQHLQCLKLLQEITAAEVTGNYLKSTDVIFKPGLIKSGKYQAVVRTAASITLIMQCAIPVLAFGNKCSEVDIGGGTNVKMAPQIDYATEVFRPLQKMLGLQYKFNLLRRGYYPRGGGLISVSVEPILQLHKIVLDEFGEVQKIDGWCFAAGYLTLAMAEEMKAAAERVLAPFETKLDIMAYQEDPQVAQHNGIGIILCANTSTGCLFGSDELGERNSDPAKMGQKAAMALLKYVENDVCVDTHAQDQLILYMVLAEGRSVIRTCKLTDHTRTAIHVAELMTGKTFKFIEKSDTDVIISCLGAGFKNKYLT